MLSNTCKYALRAVIYLAVHTDKEKKIGIRKISEELGIPTPFLGKILQTLAKNRILSSTKGPHGGFGIGENPSKTTLMDIVEVIDGKDNFSMCAIGLKPCKKQEPYCVLHNKYAKSREEIKHLFESQSIIMLAEEIKDGKQKIII